MSDIIVENKPNLVKWLSSDYGIFLQHVQAKKLLTMPQYNTLKNMQGEMGVIELLDIVLGKGEDVCRTFLDLLKKDDVNEFSPELRKWIKTVGTEDPKKEKDYKPGGSDNRPVQDQTPNRDCEQPVRPVGGYQKFLKGKTSKLIQKVKNVDSIIDDLPLHDESVANVRAKPTNQEKMRKLLDCVNCESIAKDLFNALYEHEKGLMDELLQQ